MAVENALSDVADQVSTRPRAPFGCQQARGIGTPTLLSGGKRSTPFFGRTLDALECCMAGAERVVIPAAAHNVPGDNPTTFRDAARDFLGRQQWPDRWLGRRGGRRRARITTAAA